MSAKDTSNINSSLLRNNDADNEGNWKVSDGDKSKQIIAIFMYN